MKYLLCLTEGVVHEVVDTTDWGLMFIEISEGGASHFPKAADRRALSHEELEYARQKEFEMAEHAKDIERVMLGLSKDDSGHGETTGCDEIVTASYYGAFDDSPKIRCVYTRNDQLIGVNENFELARETVHIEVNTSDYRDLSPQEAAYEAKIAAVQEPEPEPKTLPVRCLDDVEFQNLLGMNQFVKSND